MNQRSTQNVMFVSLLAGVTGAALGLLFAPRSGKETRQRLAETATDAKQRAKTGVDKAKERVDDKLHKVREAKSRLFESATGSKSKKRNKYDESPIITAWQEEV